LGPSWDLLGDCGDVTKEAKSFPNFGRASSAVTASLGPLGTSWDLLEPRWTSFRLYYIPSLVTPCRGVCGDVTKEARSYPNFGRACSDVTASLGPLGNSWNLLQPLGTSWDLLEPLGTSLNLVGPSCVHMLSVCCS
jgi:hypothetical protein